MQEAQDHDVPLNLNEESQAEDGARLDLNQPPLNQDLDPVIINPLQPAEEGEFLKLNDLQGQNKEVHYLLQYEGEVYQLNPQNPQEQELMEVPDEMHLEENNITPAEQGSPIYLQVDEVPLDQLVGPREEGFPEEEENQPEQIEQNPGLHIELLAEEENPCAPIMQGVPEGENQAIPEENKVIEAMVEDNF